MDQLDFLLQSFRAAVESDAQKERDALESETKQRREKRFEKARDEILNYSYYFIQSESEKLRNAANRKAAQRSIELHNDLLAQRRGIEDDLFAAVRARLSEYTSTPENKALFLSLMAKHKELFSGQPFVLAVAPSDMSFESDIKALYPLCRVSAAEHIMVGGFEATSPDGGFRIVETLDRKLSMLRESFSAHSELII